MIHKDSVHFTHMQIFFYFFLLQHIDKPEN